MRSGIKTNPENLGEVIDKEKPYGDQLPGVDLVELPLGKFTGNRKDFPDMTGANQGGLVSDPAIHKNMAGDLLPDTADYRERRRNRCSPTYPQFCCIKPSGQGKSRLRCKLVTCITLKPEL